MFGFMLLQKNLLKKLVKQNSPYITKNSSIIKASLKNYLYRMQSRPFIQKLETKSLLFFHKNPIAIWKLPYFSKINRVISLFFPFLGTYLVCKRHQYDFKKASNIIFVDLYLHAYFSRHITNPNIAIQEKTKLVIKEIYEPIYLVKKYIELKQNGQIQMAELFAEQLLRIFNNDQSFDENAFFATSRLLFNHLNREDFGTYLDHLPSKIKEKYIIASLKGELYFLDAPGAKAVTSESIYSCIENCTCFKGEAISDNHLILPIRISPTESGQHLSPMISRKANGEVLLLGVKGDKVFIDEAYIASTFRSHNFYYTIYDTLRLILYISINSLNPKTPILINHKVAREFKNFLREAFPQYQFIFHTNHAVIQIKRAYFCPISNIEQNSSELLSLRNFLIHSVKNDFDLKIKFKNKKYFFATKAEDINSLRPLVKKLEATGFEMVDFDLLSTKEQIALFLYAQTIITTATPYLGYSVAIGDQTNLLLIASSKLIDGFKELQATAGISAAQLHFIDDSLALDDQWSLISNSAKPSIGATDART